MRTNEIVKHRSGHTSPAYVVLGIACLFAFPCEAQAYIDPGAGSMLLQGFLGIVATTSAITIAYWKSVKAFLARVARPKRQDD
jgi:hypothetical protein